VDQVELDRGRGDGAGGSVQSQRDRRAPDRKRTGVESLAHGETADRRNMHGEFRAAAIRTGSLSEVALGKPGDGAGAFHRLVEELDVGRNQWAAAILAAEMRDTVVSDRAMESDGSGDSDSDTADAVAPGSGIGTGAASD
jgi:hypothetical protein